MEIGALVPLRCIRIHTNIDMTRVRFNSVQYNIRDLDVKICVIERNRLIVDTWLNYVKDKRTVVFCASVKHAEQIAELFWTAGVAAVAVSGSMKTSERNEQLAKFANGEIKVLCACDLLNEGWDCPQTEVLFMARPTMSKVLYTQQLGRGMRTADGKDHLMVFDFVDNASQYNMPYSLHRLFKLNEYRAGGTVVGKKGQRKAEDDLYRKGEKPAAIIDYPVNATDYELVDIFNWQEEAAGMISQMEFVRRVDVQAETIERYVREGKNIGWSTRVRYNDKHDMAYVHIFQNVKGAFTIDHSHVISQDIAVITLVNERKYGWKIFSIGERVTQYKESLSLGESIRRLLKRK